MEKIFSARTVQEAVDFGLKSLNKDRDDVEVEVVEEASKGFLGLGKRDATIRIIVEENNSASPPSDLSPPSQAEQAREFVEGIIKKMGISAELSVEDTEEGLKIDIKEMPEEKKGIVIGRRAATLDAMQYLTSLAINKGEKSYKRVFLDIEGYRKGREDALKELSHKMMKKASITGKPVRFEPMNPYERRIVHEELSKFDNVRTYSEGNEPSRYVVVTVKTEKRL